MPAGTSTFGLRETLLEPQVLPPPQTRHALLAFVIALAAVLHIGTAGWGDIHNGPEGYYAGSARELFGGDAASARAQPPLLSWLLVASFNAFGVSATAARLPIAFATVAAVACTFLIGERIAGFWRGFVAALIHLCSLGMFVWGRQVTPDPVLAALLGGAIYGGLRGYQFQRTRLRWFTGVAACTGLACLTRGAVGVLYIGSIFIVLALLFREARLRFRLLLAPRALLTFFVVVLPWPLWLWTQGAPAWAWLLPDTSNVAGLPLGKFVLHQLAWWFPGIVLVLPGLAFAARKIFRLHEFELGDALPLFWMAIGFLPLLFFPGRQDHHSIAMWSGLALWLASAWDRTSPRTRIAGLGAAVTVVIGALLTANAGILPSFVLGAETWNAVRWMVISMSVLLLISAAAAIYFVARGSETLAVAVLFLTMVPVGLSLAEGMVRFDAHFSLARAAAFLERRLGPEGEVLYEGAERDGSSLRFYLDRPFAVVDEHAAVARLAAPHPVYFIINKARVPYWQKRLTDEFHLYHQEATCGEHVVVSNQP